MRLFSALAVACAVAAGLIAVAPSVRSADGPTTMTIELAVLESLIDEIESLEQTVAELRLQLADVELDRAKHEREAAELRQFIDDHDTYGVDFRQYEELRRVIEKEQRDKRSEALRQEREARQAERMQRYEAALARRAVENAEAERLARYERAGFSALGLEVWMGRSGFAYHTIDSSTRVDYDPRIGRYLRPFNGSRVDFTRMTISGSVLNSSGEVRDIGVAIAFFDETGNQVGSTTVRVANARPDVPYPFTETIEMALNRPFETTTQYVLYADPIG